MVRAVVMKPDAGPSSQGPTAVRVPVVGLMAYAEMSLEFATYANLPLGSTVMTGAARYHGRTHGDQGAGCIDDVAGNVV
jgi:hypothetical protein